MPNGQKDNPTPIESLDLKVGAARVHCLKAGNGPPVILIHGGASDSRDWLSTMAALSAHYTSYAPDLIGFGLSDRNNKGYYLSDFSDFILRFIDVLNLEQPILVGHSFGGRICLEVALRHPEKVRKLVLVHSAGFGKVSMVGNVMLTGFWAIRKLLRRPQPFPKFLTREGENDSWLCVKDFPNIQTPTLLIWKSYDIYFPLTLARQARDLIPRARLAVIPGYGHAPHEQNKEAFNRILLDFLDAD